MTSVEGALAAWGDYDRDDPFPLFEEVRRRGPVHAVTLADGRKQVVSTDQAGSFAVNSGALKEDVDVELA